jgi:choline dehydrogenase
MQGEDRSQYALFGPGHDHGAVPDGCIREVRSVLETPISNATFADLSRPLAIRAPFPAFTASACNLRPNSRGHVRISSPDPRAYPAIQCNFLTTPEDQEVATAALKLTRRIVLGTQAMKKYEPEEFMPGPDFQSEEKLLEAARNIGTTIFHPVGTCKMGRAGDATAVVDPQLRVRGIEGLRVIDASVMPTITSGNTNAPTIMIAERTAAIMRGADSA